MGTYTYPTNGVRPHAASVVGPYPLTYDNNGNMSTMTDPTGFYGYSASYNLDNRMTSVTTTYASVPTTMTFVYDGDGGRVKKVVGTTTTRYISKLYECDSTGANTSCTRFIWAGNTRITTVATNGTTHYWHGDHLGSSSLITDSTGAKVQALSYYPYGDTRTNQSFTTPVVDVPYKYTGKELDSASNLYFYESRYYHAVFGRFIAPDTLVPDLHDPQSLNRYTYVNNNPLRYTDPTGHCPWCIVIAIGIIAGAVSSGIQSDWDLESTLLGGVIGGASAAVGYGTFGPATKAFAMLGDIGAGIAGGAVAGAAAGGTSGVLANMAGYRVNIGLAIASGAAAGGITGGAFKFGAGFGHGELAAAIAAPAAGASGAAISGADPGMGAAIAAATAAFAMGVQQAYRNGYFGNNPDQGELTIKVSDRNVSSGFCRGEYNCYYTAASFTDNGDGSVMAHMRLTGPYSRVPNVSAYWSAKDPGGLFSFSSTRTESLGSFPLYNRSAYPGWNGIQHMMIPHTDGWLTLRSNTFLNTHGETEGPFHYQRCLPRGCD